MPLLYLHYNKKVFFDFIIPTKISNTHENITKILMSNLKNNRIIFIIIIISPNNYFFQYFYNVIHIIRIYLIFTLFDNTHTYIYLYCQL